MAKSLQKNKGNYSASKTLETSRLNIYEQGYEAARICTLNALSAIKSVIGDTIGLITPDSRAFESSTIRVGIETPASPGFYINRYF